MPTHVVQGKVPLNSLGTPLAVLVWCVSLLLDRSVGRSSGRNLDMHVIGEPPRAGVRCLRL